MIVTDVNIIELVKLRYIKPLIALKEDYLAKTIVSVVAFVSSSIFNIFTVDSELILLLGIAILADWISGIMAAKRNKVFIRSLGLRQTVVKIVEYFLFLLILGGIANVFGETDIKGWVGDTLRMLRNIDWLGYFYVIFTELKSISENIAGKKGRFYDIIQIINKKMFGEKDDDHIR